MTSYMHESFRRLSGACICYVNKGGPPGAPKPQRNGAHEGVQITSVLRLGGPISLGGGGGGLIAPTPVPYK